MLLKEAEETADHPGDHLSNWNFNGDVALEPKSIGFRRCF